MAGEVRELVFAAAVEHDLAASAAHQVTGIVADAASRDQSMSAGHNGCDVLGCFLFRAACGVGGD